MKIKNINKFCNGNTWKIIGILVVIILAVAGWIWNAATVCGTVNQHEKQIEIITPKVDANTIAITGIQKDIDHLTEKVEENAKTQKEILTIQMKILKEVEN